MHGGVDRFTDLDTVQRILSIYQSQLNGGRWYSSERNVMLVLNAGVNTKTGNQAASYELWLNSVQKWEMRTDEATSGTPLEFETAGTAVVAIQTAGELDILTAGRTIRFLGTAGGDSEGIQYKDSGGTGRFGLVFPGSNVVALANRASNGVVQIRANTSAAAEAGEKTIASEFQDDKIVIGDATAGVDYIITINGETNDLTLTWMEDENYLKTNAVIRGATSFRSGGRDAF